MWQLVVVGGHMADEFVMCNFVAHKIVDCYEKHYLRKIFVNKERVEYGILGKDIRIN